MPKHGKHLCSAVAILIAVVVFATFILLMTMPGNASGSEPTTFPPFVTTCQTVSAKQFNRALETRRKLGGRTPKQFAHKPVCIRPHYRKVRADIKRLRRVPHSYPNLDGHQSHVVYLAVTKAKSMRAKCRHMLAMLEAGIVESHLRDLNYGDADSVGWLQQRPSMGWRHAGNVAMAAWDFLRRAPRADKGQSPGLVAQAVQRSGFPHKYDQQARPASRILHRAVPACR